MTPLVDYATVYLSLQEVYQLSNVEEPATSFASRMGAAFASGWRGFVGALESLAVALAYGWVWLLLLAAVGTVAGRLLWKRRRRERQAASQGVGEQAVRQNGTNSASGVGCAVFLPDF